MKIFLTFVFTVSFQLCQAATEFHFKPSEGTVTYKTKGWPNLVVMEATGRGLEGRLTELDNKVSGRLSFKIDTFESKVSSRDEHALKYMETDKYPTATIELQDLAIPTDRSGSFEFTGIMDFHGVKKAVKGKAELAKETQGQLRLSADFILNFNDFAVLVPAWNGITVAEKVKIKVDSKVQVLQ